MKITIRKGDIFKESGNILILKHAQMPHGLDRVIVEKISEQQPDIVNRLPSLNEEILIDGKILGFDQILFLGVVSLFDFKYQEITKFIKRAFEKINHSTLSPVKIVLTLHGAGYGLEIDRAFLAELEGIKLALAENLIPASLEEIVVVEKKEEVHRIIEPLLDEYLSENSVWFNFDYNSLNKRTFLLMSAALSPPKNGIELNYSGIQEVLIRLEKSDENKNVIAAIKGIIGILAAADGIERTSLNESQKAEYFFSCVNPIYLSSYKLLHLILIENYQEIEWTIRGYVLNYLVSLCEVMNLDSSFFVQEQNNIREMVKISLLNFFSKRLVPSQRFPWKYVSNILEENNIQKCWDILSEN